MTTAEEAIRTARLAREPVGEPWPDALVERVSPGRSREARGPNERELAATIVLALQIAVDSLAAALVGIGGQPIERIRIPRPRGHFSVDEIVGDIRDLVGQLRCLARDRAAIIGVGVAMVGLVRQPDGLVSRAPNLGWEDEKYSYAVLSREPAAKAAAGWP